MNESVKTAVLDACVNVKTETAQPLSSPRISI